MRVIFDLMALGAGYAQTNGRTGIYRVVENLAEKLIESPECEPEFVATHFHNEASSFLSETAAFKKYKLKYPTQKDIFLNRVRDKLHRIEDTQSGLLKTTLNRVREFGLPKTSLSQLARKASIYHSPYMPIPKEISKNHSINKFLTVHDLIVINSPQFFENNNDPLVKYAINSLGKNDWAFCVSQSTKNDLCNYTAIDPKRVFVTHLAAAKEFFYPCNDDTLLQAVRNKYSLGEEKYLLSLCTLEPRKNIAHTIRCFIKLVQEQGLKDVNLVLSGTKGWDFHHIFDELKSPEIKKRIITTGFVDDADLAALYSGAIGFVYPSLYEGFGLPPLEALQCGTPVITSNTSSLPEVVGHAGITISPTDEDALCQAMLTLISDDKMRNELSGASILQAAKFSWDTCFKQTLAGYKTATNS